MIELERKMTEKKQTSEERQRLKDMAKDRMSNKTLDEIKGQKLAQKERMSLRRAKQTSQEREKTKMQERERKSNKR